MVVGFSAWAGYRNPNKREITTDRLTIFLIGFTCCLFSLADLRSAFPYAYAIEFYLGRHRGPRDSLGKVQDYAIRVGKRILSNSTSIHIFFRDMSKNPASNVFRSRVWERSRKIRKIFLGIFQALDREPEVIEPLPHAHIGMIRCPPYEKIYRSVGYAKCIFISEIFALL